MGEVCPGVAESHDSDKISPYMSFVKFFLSTIWINILDMFRKNLQHVNTNENG